MKTSEIRKRFLDYFAARGHEIVPGGSLLPGNDPTLLFTNSGMVQFKDVFLGNQPPSSPRAATAQRCVRAGGKHNDLENVGYTARHHTFFEMLGNFSFGDYFKAEAINYAWKLLTQEFGLPAERLWVTVYEEDDEAEQIWLGDLGKHGVSAQRFSRIGAEDNFWSMGDTGPCGPCSEIFYDHGPQVAGGPPGSAEQDGDRFVEIWNLVFMQYNRGSDGKLSPLPKQSVDTGMGLERIAAILQGVHSNYEIDLFRNLINATATVLAVKNRDSQSLQHSLNVIADHIRSTAFLLVDGVLPSNEGRGYVLRRIIRRAVRHGYQLGCHTPFLHKLVQPLVDEMGEAYPELATAGAQVERVLEQENEKFNETLEQGLKILDREIAGLSGTVIPGAVAFRLYDTFGFPLDLTADVAREHGISVDHHAFDLAMTAQRTRARAAGHFARGEPLRVDGIPATQFVGHQGLESEAQVLALLITSQAGAQAEPLAQLNQGQHGMMLLDRTPFYAESGGQVGDRGEIHFASSMSAGGERIDGVFAVEDTQYLANKVIAHIGTVNSGSINIGDKGVRGAGKVVAKVAADFRGGCANHHSATHLLHAALKSVLGAHVQQKGSLLDAQRLRFDFAHFEAIHKNQLAAIEQLVNRNIRANTAVVTEVMDLAQAKAAGAEALFGETYDAQVRVVRMGEFSFELCGGTHVAQSGDIGFFKIISENGIAAGVRRIEALCGACAEEWVARQLDLLDDAASALKSTPSQVGMRLKSLLVGEREQRRQIQSLHGKLISAATTGNGTEQVKEINGVQVVAIRQDQADAKTMRMAVDQWKQQLGSGIVLVAGVNQNKVTLIAGVTDDLAARYHAGQLIQKLAPLVEGSGGGKRELAQGGGSKVEAVGRVMTVLYEWVAEVK